MFESTLINEEEGQQILKDHLDSLVSLLLENQSLINE
jgi:hypothetical protein